MPADFRSLTSVRQLANVTFAADKVIEDFLSNPDKHVARVVIPRHGSSRAPREAWKVATPDVKTFLGMLRLQFDAFLRRWFADKYPQPCVQGYVSNRSALTNARLHAGRRALVKVDVKDFFPSIGASIIQQALLKLGLSIKGAELIARVVTRQGALPLGYPTSPLFSNVVLIEVDRQLGELASAHDATYTRYADDLTFSGDGDLPMLAEIADVLRNVDLVVHPIKSKERKRGQALYVTGYSVSDTQPHAPRPLKRRLRQELYYIRKYGFSEHFARTGRASVTTEFDRILGQIEHVRYVDPKVGDDLFGLWVERPKDLDGHLVRASRRAPTHIVLLFDDSTFTFFGDEYRGMSLSVLI